MARRTLDRRKLREAADAKLADLSANRKGLFFLQMVKEAAPAAEPAAVAAQ